MKLLVVNVNTTASMTDTIVESARSAAARGTEITGLTPTVGAESVEGNFESYLAAIAVMDAVVNYKDDFDAVIQAGYGEHGREGCKSSSMCRLWILPRLRRTLPVFSDTSTP